MKILQICKKCPYPPKDGESIAIWSLVNGYIQSGNYVHILAINTPKHYFDIKKYPSNRENMPGLTLIDVNTNVKLIDLFLNLFTNKSYHYTRFCSDRFKLKLKQILGKEKFDVIQIEGLYMLQYVPLVKKYSEATIIFRAHNVESEIWERYTNNLQAGFKKWYLKLQTKRLKAFEKGTIHLADILVPITQRDAEVFKEMGYLKLICTAPVGVNITEWREQENDFDKIDFFFLGALDWMPNIEGLFWFLENVWKSFTQSDHKYIFHIAGRNASVKIHRKIKKYKNVIFHGEVENSKVFMEGKSVMIVPLLSGSGMRVKIIEAMGMGKVILSTSVGAEGILCKDGHDLLIADMPDEFIDKINYILKNKNELKSISSHARETIKTKYDNLKITKTLLGYINTNLS